VERVRLEAEERRLRPTSGEAGAAYEQAVQIGFRLEERFKLAGKEAAARAYSLRHDPDKTQECLEALQAAHNNFEEACSINPNDSGTRLIVAIFRDWAGAGEEVEQALDWVPLADKTTVDLSTLTVLSTEGKDGKRWIENFKPVPV
jgi:hypothetical protein